MSSSDDSSVPTPSHHVGYVDGVNFTISICLTYTLCVTFLRVWIRRVLFGWDDLVVGAATVRFPLCQTNSPFL